MESLQPSNTPLIVRCFQAQHQKETDINCDATDTYYVTIDCGVIDIGLGRGGGGLNKMIKKTTIKYGATSLVCSCTEMEICIYCIIHPFIINTTYCCELNM